MREHHSWSSCHIESEVTWVADSSLGDYSKLVYFTGCGPRWSSADENYLTLPQPWVPGFLFTYGTPVYLPSTWGPCLDR